MEYLRLEITIVSVKDLNNVNITREMDVYLAVLIAGCDDKAEQKKRIPVANDGGTTSFPAWKFIVDEAAARQNRLTFVFELCRERDLDDKEFGEVNVPIKELLRSPLNGSSDGKQLVTYQVKEPNGKPKGELTFSYEFVKNFAIPAVVNRSLPTMNPTLPYPPHLYAPPTPAPIGHYPSAPVPGGYCYGYHPPPPSYGHAPGAYPPPGLSAYGYAYPPPMAPYFGYHPPAAAGGVYGNPYPPPPPPPPPPQGYGYPPRAQGNGAGLGTGLIGLLITATNMIFGPDISFSF